MTIREWSLHRQIEAVQDRMRDWRTHYHARRQELQRWLESQGVTHAHFGSRRKLQHDIGHQATKDGLLFGVVEQSQGIEPDHHITWYAKTVDGWQCYDVNSDSILEESMPEAIQHLMRTYTKRLADTPTTDELESLRHEKEELGRRLWFAGQRHSEALDSPPQLIQPASAESSKHE